MSDAPPPSVERLYKLGKRILRDTASGGEIDPSKAYEEQLAEAFVLCRRELISAELVPTVISHSDLIAILNPGEKAGLSLLRWRRKAPESGSLKERDAYLTQCHQAFADFLDIGLHELRCLPMETGAPNERTGEGRSKKGADADQDGKEKPKRGGGSPLHKRNPKKHNVYLYVLRVLKDCDSDKRKAIERLNGEKDFLKLVSDANIKLRGRQVTKATECLIATVVDWKRQRDRRHPPTTNDKLP